MKRTILVAAVLFAGMVGCRKDKDTPSLPKTPSELLTQNEWILTTGGFDDDSSGTIEGSEEIVQDCAKDNSYFFNVNGTGKYADNAQRCATDSTGNFTWKIVDSTQKKYLVLSGQPWKLRKLTETELIVAEEEFFTTHLLMVYRKK